MGASCCFPTREQTGMGGCQIQPLLTRSREDEQAFKQFFLDNILTRIPATFPRRSGSLPSHQTALS